MAMHLDLFIPQSVAPPPPATIHDRIKDYAYLTVNLADNPDDRLLPSLKELNRRFDSFNELYFEGKLPRVRIEYSERMSTMAGSYTPSVRLIKLSRRYHELFPHEIDDTLKHEMLHIKNPRHDRAFKLEAARIGTSVKAQCHPSLRRPPKFIYHCTACGKEYPRQKRFRMASCGSCSPKKFNVAYKLILKKGLV